MSSMNTNGSWAVDNKALKELAGEDQFKTLLEAVKDETLAYTIYVYQFMKLKYASEEDELRLMYRKVQRFVEESCKKMGVSFKL